MHHLIEEPESYDGRRCVVVGGGDVAVEAALALAERPGTQVTLCHRGERFERARPENQDLLAEAERGGALSVLRQTQLREIRAEAATVEAPGGARELPGDAVFVLIGAELPTDLLSSSGIQVRTYRGDPAPIRA